MSGVREKLNAFLDKAASRPFEWGVADCALEVADWLDQSCGLDIAAERRGAYSTEEGAYALVGDLETEMRAQAVRHGLAETTQPRFGDVALVSVVGQDKPLAAILMPSGRWRMKTLAGVKLSADVTVIVAWELSCRPKPPEPVA